MKIGVTICQCNRWAGIEIEAGMLAEVPFIEFALGNTHERKYRNQADDDCYSHRFVCAQLNDVFPFAWLAKVANSMKKIIPYRSITGRRFTL